MTAQAHVGTAPMVPTRVWWGLRTVANGLEQLVGAHARSCKGPDGVGHLLRNEVLQAKHADLAEALAPPGKNYICKRLQAHVR